MGIQYFNRGWYQLRRHPPLKILVPIHYDTIEDGQIFYSLIQKVWLCRWYCGIETKDDIKGGTAPPTPKSSKLPCFVLYLQIINIFLKQKNYASYSKLSKELKNSIKI